MFKVEKKAIKKVMRFFGCSSMDAIYYLMPNKFIDEGRVTDFTIVEAVPVLAAEIPYRRSTDCNQSVA